MTVSLLIPVAAVVSAVLVGFVARRILGTAVGWPRSIVVGLLVFFVGVPFAEWTLRQTGTSPDASGNVGLWLALIALAIAWAFAIGVAALVASEAIFPTRPLPNPVDLVRAALRQRKRTRRHLEILAIPSRHGLGLPCHVA